jgi:hypothetical protein
LDIFEGIDTFFVRENQVLNFNVEMTNIRSIFKHQIHYMFELFCIAGKVSYNRVIKLRSYICTIAPLPEGFTMTTIYPALFP